jgi:hypothetical protein
MVTSKHTNLGLSRLDKVLVVLRMVLLDAALDHLLHDGIAVNDNALLDLATRHRPLALDMYGSRGRLAVDGGVDTLWLVDEGESERRLSDGPLVCHLVDTRLAEGRLARDLLVGDELGARDLDVDIVVVERCNDSLFLDACCDGSGDGGFGRHLDAVWTGSGGFIC